MQTKTERLENPFLHYGLIFLIYGTGFLTIITSIRFFSFLHFPIHRPDTIGEGNIVIPYQACQYIGPNHIISIEKKGFVPDSLTVMRCDRVTFVNITKSSLYLPEFGDHPHDTIYSGFPQKVLAYQESETFIAHTAGLFGFHDHLKDEMEGTLVVK